MGRGVAAFIGTTLACLALAVGANLWWQQLAGKLVLAAALLYLLACFGLTMVLHQPMNLRLAALDAAQALAYWPRCRQSWTRWNMCGPPLRCWRGCCSSPPFF